MKRNLLIVFLLVIITSDYTSTTMSLSTGTLNLKFMQRGAAGPSAPVASTPTTTARKADPAHWVLPSSSSKSKGKAKAVVQDVEFEGSYLPFLALGDEEQSGSGRRTFGQAPVPVSVVGGVLMY